MQPTRFRRAKLNPWNFILPKQFKNVCGQKHWRTLLSRYVICEDCNGIVRFDNSSRPSDSMIYLLLRNVSIGPCNRHIIF